MLLLFSLEETQYFVRLDIVFWTDVVLSKLSDVTLGYLALCNKCVPYEVIISRQKDYSQRLILITAVCQFCLAFITESCNKCTTDY